MTAAGFDDMMEQDRWARQASLSLADQANKQD
jgi:hypothetical protein